MPLTADELELRRLVLLMGTLRLGASLTVMGRSRVAAIRKEWVRRGWISRRTDALTPAGRARFRASLREATDDEPPSGGRPRARG